MVLVKTSVCAKKEIKLLRKLVPSEYQWHKLRRRNIDSLSQKKNRTSNNADLHILAECSGMHL